MADPMVRLVPVGIGMWRTEDGRFGITCGTTVLGEEVWQVDAIRFDADGEHHLVYEYAACATEQEALAALVDLQRETASTVTGYGDGA